MCVEGEVKINGEWRAVGLPALYIFIYAHPHARVRCDHVSKASASCRITVTENIFFWYYVCANKPKRASRMGARSLQYSHC